MSKILTENLAPNKEKLLEFINVNIECYVATKIEIVTDKGHTIKFKIRDTPVIVKLLRIDRDILFNRVFAWNIDRTDDTYTVILYI